MNYSKLRNDFEKAILDSKLSSNQKLVALALKSHMNNDDGRCFPSVTTLATECSLADKTVRNAVRELVVAGFISKISGNGRGKSTHYSLHPIQSDVNNVNKHKGNPATLLSNYSADIDVSLRDFSQDDFEVETPKQINIVSNNEAAQKVGNSISKSNHLDVLETVHRQSALRALEHDGKYFNEHYRQWLDADGNELEIDDWNF